MERIKINSITIDEAKKYAVFVVKKSFAVMSTKFNILAAARLGMSIRLILTDRLMLL
jgi:hypothetical protein